MSKPGAKNTQDPEAKQGKAITVKEIGKASPEQLAKWHKEHGEDRVIQVKIVVSATEEAYAYFRKPNRIHIARALPLVHNGQRLEAGESILDDTWLDGDPRCASLEDRDTDFRVATALELFHNTTVLTAELKNV